MKQPAAIWPSDLQFDSAKLKNELIEIQRRVPFHPIFKQISLVHGDNSGTERAYDGCGSLYDSVQQKFIRQPSEFIHFNRDFEDLYFFEVYQRVREWSRLRLGRMRLMLRPPGSCYSMHFDDAPRYHIAISANENCYFYFKGLGMYRIPPDGKLFHFDATKLHTGFNAGATDRVHLVFDTIAPDLGPKISRVAPQEI